jgi:hypothetical protein
VVVGAPGFDFTTQAGHFDKYPGRAYVFARGARGWYQEAELAGSDAGPSALFGYSVAVSGHTIVVGAPGAPSVPTEGPGRAYVFERVASGWRQVAELKGAAAPTAFAFGASVGVSGGTAVVGTQYLTHGSYRAYMFQEGASGWQRTAVLADTRTAGLGDDDTFAGSVAVSDGTVVVGAPQDDNSAGRTYVFAERGTGWAQVAKLVGSDTVAGDNFGSSVGVSGGTVLVAAADAGKMLGATYVFERARATGTRAVQRTAPRSP